MGLAGFRGCDALVERPERPLERGVRRPDHAPYPSFADVLWLLWYPLVALGIALLIRFSVPCFELHRWLDGLGVTLLTLAAGFVLVI